MYLFFVLAILHFNTAHAKVKLPDNVTISALYAFGDSILDTGNNNNLPTAAKCNFCPYGRDFLGGGATGRFCNGKVPSDIVVSELGIKEVIPAYLDPKLNPEELLTGVNFASGAAGYDPLTSLLASAIPLTAQVELFKQYFEKLKQAVGEEKAKNITAHSVSLISVSSNDIANTYFLSPTRIVQYNVSGYADYLVGKASEFLEQLLGVGLPKIGVFGAPPLGCLPFVRTAGGGPERNCVEKYSKAAQLFNEKLMKAIDDLNEKHPDGKMVYIDDFTILNDIIQYPKKYGFEVANRGCCGTGLYEVAVLCNRFSPCTCANASNYIFWDSYHPTEKTYKIIVDHLIQDVVNRLFSK